MQMSVYHIKYYQIIFVDILCRYYTQIWVRKFRGS